MFTRAEKIELALVALAVCALAQWSGRLPFSLELGSALAIGALALLGQGLLRDLWLLSRRRLTGGMQGPREEARCMCLESTIGLAGVIAGVVLTAAAVTIRIKWVPWFWPGAGATVWIAGFLMKDMVIQWSPWKVRRIKDHGSILVRWR